MGCDGDNPRILPPTPPQVIDPGPRSLAEQLAGIVNDARAINTELGLRPYRVLSVRVHWSGGERGRGDVTRVWEREFLPRPKVEPKVFRELRDAGIVERGGVLLTEVNPQLTEDEVMDLFHQRLQPGDDGYLEVFMDERDGSTERRPYAVDSVPERRADRFDWKVRLVQLSKGRERNGQVAYPGKR